MQEKTVASKMTAAASIFAVLVLFAYLASTVTGASMGLATSIRIMVGCFGAVSTIVLYNSLRDVAWPLVESSSIVTSARSLMSRDVVHGLFIFFGAIFAPFVFATEYIRQKVTFHDEMSQGAAPPIGSSSVPSV